MNRQDTVRQALEAAFRCYGLPERMLMDNGSPWSDGAQTPYTQLAVWLLRLDIAISHGRPFHPQTQGKDERLHRTLNAELLTLWQQLFDGWRTVCNQQRPHQAIDDQPPSCRYQASKRPFPEKLPVLDYPSTMRIRRGDANGQISFQGSYLRVGKAFKGHPRSVFSPTSPRRTTFTSISDASV